MKWSCEKSEKSLQRFSLSDSNLLRILSQRRCSNSGSHEKVFYVVPFHWKKTPSFLLIIFHIYPLCDSEVMFPPSASFVYILSLCSVQSRIYLGICSRCFRLSQLTRIPDFWKSRRNQEEKIHVFGTFIIYQLMIFSLHFFFLLFLFCCLLQCYCSLFPTTSFF